MYITKSGQCCVYVNLAVRFNRTGIQLPFHPSPSSCISYCLGIGLWDSSPGNHRIYFSKLKKSDRRYKLHFDTFGLSMGLFAFVKGLVNTDMWRTWCSAVNAIWLSTSNCHRSTGVARVLIWVYFVTLYMYMPCYKHLFMRWYVPICIYICRSPITILIALTF